MCLNQQRACQITTKAKAQYLSQPGRPAAKLSIVQHTSPLQSIPPLSSHANVTRYYNTNFMDFITALTTRRITQSNCIDTCTGAVRENNCALDGLFRCRWGGKCTTTTAQAQSSKQSDCIVVTKKEQDKSREMTISLH